MTIQELIERLSKFDPNAEIMVLDGANAGGVKRTINFGPVRHSIDEVDARDTADCEERVGEKVVVIGYGCY